MKILKVGVRNYQNMANSGIKSPAKGRPFMNPRGVAHSKRDVTTLNARSKSQKYAQGIVIDWPAMVHNAVLDIGNQQSMVGMGGWDIIKHRYTCIDAKGVNMGGSSNSGHRLKLVDARCVVKKCLDGKRYLVIVRKYVFNPNSDETLFVENKIECFGVKVYSRPRLFGGKQMVDSRHQVVRSVNLDISWYVSTRCLYTHPPTR